MRISTIKYFIQDAFRSLWRNRTISLASIATVAATIFIFGVFMLTGLNIGKGVKDVESNVEIRVYINEDISINDKNALESQLKAEPGVKDVVFESKEQAFENFKKSLKDKASLLSGYDVKSNPMPISFIVKLKDPKYAEEIAAKYEKAPGVDEIGKDQELINQISSFANGVKWVGVAIFIVLIAVSLFLIANTIKITVFSRRREVGIMKFVGATDWFIRWPFVIEGMVIGIIGAVISTVVLYFAYRYVFMNVSASMLIAQLLPPSYVYTTMLWEFMLSGILIGTVGSIVSLRKFLVV
ncbi:cell division protein FtsX [Clostridium amylolyticum]|uniref:Cell division protein FtsX n=1 Tax=Clostridium amylolyticum TaxID=1121298 RepID=A0A1M6H0N2_9CLOT|nr:permease-like cell division protein FtsX [Clostridium amylolyticum]SHJ15783.1 cell division protein FtsX [Clostridium amylolyticum]